MVNSSISLFCLLLCSLVSVFSISIWAKCRFQLPNLVTYIFGQWSDTFSFLFFEGRQKDKVTWSWKKEDVNGGRNLFLSMQQRSFKIRQLTISQDHFPKKNASTLFCNVLPSQICIMNEICACRSVFVSAKKWSVICHSIAVSSDMQLWEKDTSFSDPLAILDSNQTHITATL